MTAVRVPTPCTQKAQPSALDSSPRARSGDTGAAVVGAGVGLGVGLEVGLEVVGDGVGAVVRVEVVGLGLGLGVGLNVANDEVGAGVDVDVEGSRVESCCSKHRHSWPSARSHDSA